MNQVVDLFQSAQSTHYETYCISIRVLRSLKDVFVVQPDNLVSEFQILSNNHLVIYMKKDRSR